MLKIVINPRIVFYVAKKNVRYDDRILSKLNEIQKKMKLSQEFV